MTEDIKADNILQELVDKEILNSFTQSEIEFPSPRKFVNGAPIYVSRRFDRPKKFGDVVLSDFGSAVRGDQKRNHDAQPNVYRSPEVMLKVEWSYPVDIWNVGVMVSHTFILVIFVTTISDQYNQIWDLFEGRHLFYGNDPENKGYTTRAHLAEVVALLGLPPLELLQRGKRIHEFFTDDGLYYGSRCIIVQVPYHHANSFIP